MILACTCQHDYQDNEYGKGQRVHNLREKDGVFKGWRCTVCTGTKMDSKPANLK